MDTEQAIGEAVRRLVEYFRPEQVYLFGSTARGEAGAGSDLDFLVVVGDDAPRRLLTSGKEYEKLSGIPVAVDVVPMRRSAFESRKGRLMSIPALALREGRLVYDGRPEAA
jgi:uncharacterized protein